MITKGGLEAVMRSLAMEYVKQGIRVNVVAPGVVDTPMHNMTRRIFSGSCNRWDRFPKCKIS
jgi:NAD(P)-dependent dehydrogenase (short-subunit alcohol dehydrogenase family)